MISRGAPAKFTSHKGSWGNQFIIEKKKIQKKSVSCHDCMYYYSEDDSCYKTEIIPNHQPTKYWIMCKHFKLSIEFNNDNEKVSKVITEKGPSALERRVELPNSKKIVNSIIVGKTGFTKNDSYESLKKMVIEYPYNINTRNHLMSMLPDNTKDIICSNMFSNNTENQIDDLIFIYIMQFNLVFRDHQMLVRFLKSVKRYIAEGILENEYNLKDEVACEQLILDAVMKRITRIYEHENNLIDNLEIGSIQENQITKVKRKRSRRKKKTMGLTEKHLVVYVCHILFLTIQYTTRYPLKMDCIYVCSRQMNRSHIRNKVKNHFLYLRKK